MRRALVIQHCDSGRPGLYGDALEAAGCTIDLVDTERGEVAPDDPAGYDGILMMGGIDAAYDTVDEPWQIAERALLVRAVERGTPVLAICLGAQLLAAALGGRVWRGPVPEVGVADVLLHPAAADDPLLGGLPARLPMFHWHGDTYEPPAGAVHLASSDRYRQQAFRIGPCAWGLQFHAEARIDRIRDGMLVPDAADQLRRAGCDPARMLAEAEAALPTVNGHGHVIAARFARLVANRMVQ